jgi:hypothetical protein
MNTTDHQSIPPAAAALLDEALETVADPKIDAFLSALDSLRDRVASLAPSDVARLNAIGADFAKLAKVTDALLALAETDGIPSSDRSALVTLRSVLSQLSAAYSF